MKNIIGEGVLQKVFNWALNKKVKKVGKRIQLDPKLAKLKKKADAAIAELEKTANKNDPKWDAYLLKKGLLTKKQLKMFNSLDKL